MAEWRENLQQVDSKQEKNKDKNDDLSNRYKRNSDTGFVTAVLTGFNSSGEALVRSDKISNNQAMPARTIIALNSRMIGDDVLLAFESNDKTKPIVMGLLQTHSALKNVHHHNKKKENNLRLPDAPDMHIKVDDECIEINAKQKIVLRCGSASITLQRDGRVVVRGTDILTRSAGLNRIKGGAVQIN